ncbi:MAG: hypothetical protein LBD21_04195 [Tannerellaceae bacterium]|jgi:hypothetical protein|nr:hypothetical protein [Tannerellaceae bacterium]
MAKHRADWLPQSHGACHALINQAWKYLDNTEIRARFGFGIETVYNPAINSPSHWLDNVFKPRLDEYNEVYGEWINQEIRTIVISAKFFRVEGELRTLFRQLYSGFVKGNIFIQEEDLEAMGFPKHRTARTEVPVPKGVPEMELHTPTTLVLIVSYHNQGAHGTARPDGVAFMEFRYAIRTKDDRQPSYEELTLSLYDTSSPIKLTFKSVDRGKYIYCAGRWINSRGKPGDWSYIYSRIVS